MSRELFKETFFPLGIDDLTVYKWFIDGHRRWRVFREDSCNVGAFEMDHIATTRGKDELLYFNKIADDYKSIFTNVDVMFYDDNFKFAWNTYENSGFSMDGKHTHDRQLDAEGWTDKIIPSIDSNVQPFGDAVEHDVIFSSDLKVFFLAPDEYCGPNSKYRKHLEAMLDIHELYYTKNKDYGDAFTQSLDKHGPIAALVRMEDKWNRLSNLIAKGTGGYILSESVEDTLIDLANYAIMTALYLRGNQTDD